MSQHLWIYARRLLKPSQMDFQYTAWTMLQLLISPKTACRHTSYHRQTKDHWARDDPAFVVILAGIVAVTSAAYAAAFSSGFRGALWYILCAFFRDFIGLGALMTVTVYLVVSRLLFAPNKQEHTIEQRVEWMYAFDVHCNAVLPWILLTQVVQLVLSPILLSASIFAALLSCTLYFLAASAYLYITFLGYSVLPGVENTTAFLLPILGLAVLLPILVIMHVNPTRLVLWAQFGYQ